MFEPRPPVAIPSELWEIALTYSFDGFHKVDDEERHPLILPQPFGVQWRLLSHAIFDAIDGLITAALEGTASWKNGHALQLRAPCHRMSNIQHRRALLTLARSSVEFLASVVGLEGGIVPEFKHYLFEARIDVDGLRRIVGSIMATVAQMSNLKWIEGPFMSRCTALRTVDLRGLVALSKIGDHFLSSSTVEVVMLPHSLETVGNWFLSHTRVQSIDLSSTSLKRVGTHFLSASPICIIVGPTTWSVAGHRFLSKATSRRVDLSQTYLTQVGRSFLGGAYVRVLRLPPSLQVVGDDFLLACKRRHKDPSITSLTVVTFRSLGNAKILVPPLTLMSVGDYFLWGFRGRKLDLSGMRLETVGADFLGSSAFQQIRLPTTLTVVPGDVFVYYSGSVLDLSGTWIEVIGNFFGSSFRCIKRLIMPRTLKVIGDNFLDVQAESSLTQLDLSSTNLETVGENFLPRHRLEELAFPSTLKTVGDNFLKGCRLCRLDLSATALENVGVEFLADAQVPELSFPPTLRVAGHSFLRGFTQRRLPLPKGHTINVTNLRLVAQGKESSSRCALRGNASGEAEGWTIRFRHRPLDLSHTALEIVGNCFLKGTSFEQICLPHTLKIIGDGFLEGADSRRIDLSHAFFEVVGKRFLAESEVEEVQLPHTLKDFDRDLFISREREADDSVNSDGVPISALPDSTVNDKSIDAEIENDAGNSSDAEADTSIVSTDTDKDTKNDAPSEAEEDASTDSDDD